MNFLKLVFVTTISITILVLLILVYWDSDRTKVKNVRITQNISKPDTYLNSRIVDFIENKSIFDIDKIDLEKEVKLLSKELKSANVVIYPPDTVYVNLVYSEPIVKLLVGNKYILYDENLNQINSYDEASLNEAITLVARKAINKEILRDIVMSLQNTDKSIKRSKYFPSVFVFDENGIHGFNVTFKINIYFGFSIDETKIKKAFLSTKYIIQKKLPVRYIDARFDNVIAN
ncbi:MAG: hypothetical protein ACK4F9_01735 [Brevinematia bacterium]